MDSSTLIERLGSGEATVGVVGLGYVGLPVALAFAAKGFKVVGVDRDDQRVTEAAAGRSPLVEIEDEDVARQVDSKRLRVTTSFRPLSRADAILICVPTPLKDGQPDVSYIEAAGKAVSRVLSPGTLVILESTTYPGTTEELLKPLLEAGGLTAGADFLLAYSPERIDPGNEKFAFQDITKIVGGIDPESTRAAEALYLQVVPKVFTVSDTRTAEAAKLMENTFRHVNIALVNEIALYAHDLGVDIWEVIEAAASKPFGFMPFWPSAGWGGHCIPLDPSYLSYSVRKGREHDVRFVELAHAINSEMPKHIVERIAELLNDRGKSVKGSRVLGVGIAYKGNVGDVRGSAGIKVLNSLARKGADVCYHDPLVDSATINGSDVGSTKLDDDVLGESDVVILFHRQRDVDFDLIKSEARLIFDCANVMGEKAENIVRL
jgi:nucleotide sugar dehydrogenase